MLGLKHGENFLVDYDSGWPRLFDEESLRLKAVLADLACGIEHYGSTAVPGLPAKPILDILVGVQSIENWVTCKPLLESLGYDYADRAGVADHFIFGRGRDQTERTHLVHVVTYQGNEWHTGLRFRDALRSNRELREDYLAAKKHAAAIAPTGRAAYNAVKQDFIQTVIEDLA